MKVLLDTCAFLWIIADAPELPDPPARFVPAQRRAHRIAALPLDEEATLRVSGLPDWHRDPFDRILICQALAGGMTLLTPDPLIQRYPVTTLW